MSERVTMPALGESVTEGTVTRWLKQVGDTVAVDEPLLEVSTDKVDTEIPSPVAGVLQEVLVGEDDTVPVGADLAVIGDGQAGTSGGGAGGGAQAAAPEQAPEQAAEQDAPQQEAQPEQAPAEQPQQASPEQPAAQGGGEAEPARRPSGGAHEGGGGTTVTMPALGESVTEGTVTRWLKAEGDTVEVDEPLLEVSTDKVDTEIPSPVAGTVTRLLVAEDETVPVGADLAVVGGEPSGDGAGGQATAQAAPAAEQQREEPAPAADLGDEARQQQQEREKAAELESPAAQPAHAQQERAEQAEQAPPREAQPQQAQPQQAQPQQAQPQQAQPAQAQPAQGLPQPAEPPTDAAAYVTPLVRKLAAEQGVDLASLTGTGVGGRIRKQDVLEAAETQRRAQEQAKQQPAEAPQQAPAAAAPSRPSVPASVSAKRGTTEKMSRLRKLIATRMVESLQTSAQLTTVIEVDVTRIARLRDRAKAEFQAREGVKLSFLPFFALAAVEALKAHPTVNASIEGDQIVYHAQENLGIAVDTEKGLIVPVIRDAGDLNIAGIARKIADLADRTRRNKIGPDELGGGTFTLTNTGSRGALFDTPIINQPQVGILGTGAVVKRPVVVKDADGGESIAVRSMVYLALSYDHRIVDGADAARFLVSIKERLEEGAFEADLGL
jgi:2-oxoglutarate dehydrogenase E2 component (dihydrolipoamide succinyltransferase)